MNFLTKNLMPKTKKFEIREGYDKDHPNEGFIQFAVVATKACNSQVSIETLEDTSRIYVNS